MSAKEKLVNRFKGLPKDFTFDELCKLLNYLGYESSNKGKMSGSRVRFSNRELKSIIDLHKPHASGIPIKETTLKEIYNNLFLSGLINKEVKKEYYLCIDWNTKVILEVLNTAKPINVYVVRFLE
jgi:hypothetical protein